MRPRSEFSRVVIVEPWPEGGVRAEAEANERERAALAGRLGVVAVERLAGHGRFERPAAGTVIRLHGRLLAEVVQRCVVTLEPLTARLDLAFERSFLPQAQGAAGSREVAVDPEEEEPEPLVGGRVDLGEVLVEELALSLDPYPRATRPALDLPPEVARHVSVELDDPDE